MTTIFGPGFLALGTIVKKEIPIKSITYYIGDFQSTRICAQNGSFKELINGIGHDRTSAPTLKMVCYEGYSGR